MGGLTYLEVARWVGLSLRRGLGVIRWPGEVLGSPTISGSGSWKVGGGCIPEQFPRSLPGLR